ncbi:MAG: 4Fe-4S dicluster domain-containing protein [Bacteroidales bacterium]
MESIRKKAKELLEKNAVQVIIGYGEGLDKSVSAIFVRKPENAETLIFDDRCVHNLAVYLLKNEIKALGKPCIIAHLAALRTILQLASEHQITEDDVLVLGVTHKGELMEFAGFKDIEKYIASANIDISENEKEIINKLEAMTREERWQFWVEHLSLKCIKCYACRAACPMCYCSRCQVEYNQPQWITVEATPVGIIEWHITRAMHIAGRCVSCGECYRACPMNIPINLLNYLTVLTIKEKFNVSAGTSADLDSVMSSFKSDDKENFIKQS